MKSPSSSMLPGRAARRPRAANSLRHWPARPHTGALVCTLVTVRGAGRPPASSSSCTVGMWKAEPSTESTGMIGREEYTAPPPAPSRERLIRCGSSAPSPSASSRFSRAGESSWTARSPTPFSRTSRTTSAASAWPFQALRLMTFSSADGRCPVPCPMDSSCPCKGSVCRGRSRSATRSGGNSHSSCKARRAPAGRAAQGRRAGSASRRAAPAGSANQGVKATSWTTGAGHGAGTARKMDTTATGAAQRAEDTCHRRLALRRFTGRPGAAGGRSWHESMQSDRRRRP